MCFFAKTFEKLGDDFYLFEMQFCNYFKELFETFRKILLLQPPGPPRTGVLPDVFFWSVLLLKCSPGSVLPVPISWRRQWKSKCLYHFFYFFNKIYIISLKNTSFSISSVLGGEQPSELLQQRLSSVNHGNERNKVFVYHPHFYELTTQFKKS